MTSSSATGGTTTYSVAVATIYSPAAAEATSWQESTAKKTTWAGSRRSTSRVSGSGIRSPAPWTSSPAEIVRLEGRVTTACTSTGERTWALEGPEKISSAATPDPTHCLGVAAPTSYMARRAATACLGREDETC